MARRFLICLMWFVMVVLAPVAWAQEARPRLTWAPPTQSNPTKFSVYEDPSGAIVTVRSPYPYTSPVATLTQPGVQVLIKLNSGEDAVIELPKDRPLRIPGLQVNKGRHVRIIGGQIEATRPADQTLRAVLRFAAQSGSVFVEGMVLDAKNQYGLDGLDVGSVSTAINVVADIYVQNCLIRGTYSKQTGLHADGFQYYGGTGWTRMDRVSIVAQYQGLFLDPQADIGGIDLRRVDLRYTDNYGTGYLFFLRTELPTNLRRPPVSLSEVYSDEPVNRRPWEEFTIYPPASREVGVRVTDGKGYFPAFPEVTGYVTKGVPPDGPFVTDKTAGLNYVSPGYGGAN